MNGVRLLRRVAEKKTFVTFKLCLFFKSDLILEDLALDLFLGVVIKKYI